MKYLIRLLVVASLVSSFVACSAEENGESTDTSDEPDEPVCDAIALRCCDENTGQFVQNAECTTDGLKCPDGTSVDACESIEDIDEETTEPEADSEPVCDAIAIQCCDPSTGEVIGNAECTPDGLKCLGEGTPEACGDNERDVAADDSHDPEDTHMGDDDGDVRHNDTGVSDASKLPDDKCRNSEDCGRDEDGIVTPKQCIAPGEFTGCGSGCAMPRQTCQDNSECGDNEVCINPPRESCICTTEKVCRPACESDADCESFERCGQSGRCVTRTCEASADCEDPFAVCKEGTCKRASCDGDSKCPNDGKCVKGMCYGQFGNCRILPQ